MQTQVRRRDPEIRHYFPNWCHHHGVKMRLKSLDKEKHILVIGGSAATVTIKPAKTIEPDMKDGEWFVDWEVVQHRWGDETVRGRRWFRRDELEAAFGLTDHSGDCGQWVIDRFGATCAEQGKFIRWERFLNIPCPGTGHDGDPNVSIHLDEEIYQAVRLLLDEK